MVKIKGVKRSWTNLLRYIIDNFTKFEAAWNYECWRKHWVKPTTLDIIATIKKPDDLITSIDIFYNTWQNKNINFWDKEVVKRYLEEYEYKYKEWIRQWAKIVKLEDILADPDTTLSFLKPKKIQLPKNRILPSWQELRFANEKFEKRKTTLSNYIKDLIEKSEAMNLYNSL